jgi:hypothetical protein
MLAEQSPPLRDQPNRFPPGFPSDPAGPPLSVPGNPFWSQPTPKVMVPATVIRDLGSAGAQRNWTSYVDLGLTLVLLVAVLYQTVLLRRISVALKPRD